MTMKKIKILDLSSNRESDSQKPVNRTSSKQADQTKKSQRTGQITILNKKIVNRQFLKTYLGALKGTVLGHPRIL